MRSVTLGFSVLLLLLTTACGVDHAEPDEPLAAAAHAVDSDVPNDDCESKRNEIVPYSTTTCSGPLATCQAVGTAWLLRGSQIEIKSTVVGSASQCASYANSLVGTKTTGTVRTESTLIGFHQTGSFQTRCEVTLNVSYYDQVTQCTRWSTPVGNPPVRNVVVGQQACTTCDDISPDTAQDARASCMFNLVNADTGHTLSYRGQLVAGLKYLYEHGGNLTGPPLSYVKPLFQSDPRAVPACGAAPVLAVCNTEIDWRLNLCARLSNDFARKARNARLGGTGSWGTFECNKVIALLADLPANSCPQTKAAALTILRDVQGAITRDFAQPGWMDGAAEPPGGAVVKQRLDQLGIFEGLATRLLPPDQIDALMRPLLDPLLELIHARLLPPRALPEANHLVDYLARRFDDDLEASRALLAAIYPTPGTVPNVGPWSQVNLVPEAIEPLAARLEGFLPVQDIRCTLNVCPDIEDHLDKAIVDISIPGSTVPVWQSASLVISASDKARINAWAQLLADVFGPSSPHANALPEAIAKFLPAGASQLSALPADNVPAPLRRLYAPIARAAERQQLYTNTGRFTSAEGKKIHRLTNLDNREKMARDVEAMATDAVTHANAFNNEFVGLVNTIINGTTVDAQLTGLRTQYDGISAHLKDLQLQKAGHERAISTDRGTEDRIGAMTTLVQPDFHGELATQFVGRADRPAPVFVKASSATFSSLTNDISTYQVFASPALTKDQLYQVSISGSWVPTCALRRFSKDLFAARDTGSWYDHVIDFGASLLRDLVIGHGLGEGLGLIGQLIHADRVEIDLTNAETGPEGYTVVQSAGKYTVESASTSVQPGVAGVGGGYHDEDGSSFKVDAAFSSGLRLPSKLITLPSNDAPVGALLAVEMPAGKTQIADAVAVYVVKAPTTVLPVSVEGAHFAFVANDNCSTDATAPRNDSVQLHIDTAVLTGGDQLLRAFITAMADVIENFRVVKTPAYVAQGELLVTDTATLEQEAFLLFKHAVVQKAPALAETPFDQLPTAFQRLYSLFIEREINRIDRLVRLVQLEREINLANVELDGLSEQVHQLTEATSVSRRLREWNLSRLDQLAAQSDVDRAREYLLSYLLPVFELWYPDAIAPLASKPEVKALEQLTAFTTSLEYALKLSDALKKVASAYRDESNFRYNHLSAPMLVVVSIPDPHPPCVPAAGPPTDGPPTGGPPSGGPPTSPGNGCGPPVLANGRPVSPEQAEGFWDALRAGMNHDSDHAHYTLRIDPSTLYSNVVEPFHLVCQAQLPVVTRFAFMPIRPTGTNASQGTYLWPIDFGEKQTYVSAEGAQEFSLLDHLGKPEDRTLVTNLIFSDTTSLEGRFREANHVATASGISPFTTYELDFSNFGPQLIADLQGVAQFALVIEVEAVSGGRAAVPVCNAGH